MRRTVAVMALMACAGCAAPTWKRHLVGAGLPEDKVVLVGSFTTVPAIQQRGNAAPRGGTFVNGRYEPTGGVVFIGEQKGNVAAVFTPDLSEAWQQDALSVGFDTYDWAWFPMDGTYVIEVQRQPRLNLRGVFYVTDGGSVRIELPAHVELRPDDRVVYVGEIRVVRTGERRTLFNDRLTEAREALKAAGYDDVLAVPWRKRLFAPTEVTADRRAQR
jgi:hypothetical protein